MPQEYRKYEENVEIKRVHLDEITIMRPILICIFLVGYHSFAPWGGVWEMPEAIKGEGVRAYFWLDKFLYSFMLETFVFISGYLFAYQKYSLNRKFTLLSLIKNKFKRLIIPSVVFSVLYSFISYKSDFELGQYLYDIACGLGHLWFLPMLFWCFVMTYFLEKIKISYWKKLVLLLVLSVVINGHENDLPLRLGNVCYYIFYFYMAFGIFNRKVEIIKRFTISNKVWGILFLYVFAFIIFSIIVNNPINSESTLSFVFYKGLCHFSNVVYSTLGLIAFYLIVNRFLNNGYSPSKMLICLNPLCMGIYILHNFVLSLIYEKTILPSILGTYLLPWCAYVFALTGGIIGTFLLRKIKVGKALC